MQITFSQSCRLSLLTIIKVFKYYFLSFWNPDWAIPVPVKSSNRSIEIIYVGISYTSRHYEETTLRAFVGRNQHHIRKSFQMRLINNPSSISMKNSRFLFFYSGLQKMTLRNAHSAAERQVGPWK